jgi:hypothetical protein
MLIAAPGLAERVPGFRGSVLNPAASGLAATEPSCLILPQPSLTALALFPRSGRCPVTRSPI